MVICSTSAPHTRSPSTNAMATGTWRSSDTDAEHSCPRARGFGSTPDACRIATTDARHCDRPCRLSRECCRKSSDSIARATLARPGCWPRRGTLPGQSKAAYLACCPGRAGSRRASSTNRRTHRLYPRSTVCACPRENAVGARHRRPLDDKVGCKAATDENRRERKDDEPVRDR